MINYVLRSFKSRLVSATNPCRSRSCLIIITLNFDYDTIINDAFGCPNLLFSSPLDPCISTKLCNPMGVWKSLDAFFEPMNDRMLDNKPNIDLLFLLNCIDQGCSILHYRTKVNGR